MIPAPGFQVFPSSSLMNIPSWVPRKSLGWFVAVAPEMVMAWTCETRRIISPMERRLAEGRLPKRKNISPAKTINPTATDMVERFHRALEEEPAWIGIYF